jgi:hypothetical protein
MTTKLLQQPRRLLESVIRRKFYGAGVYALYYKGDHPAYHLLRESEVPIYVGKAEPEVSGATTVELHGTRLHGRLNDHVKSIRAAERFALSDEGIGLGVVPLRLDDFECRSLTLSSAYVGACEANLITHFEPAWNEVCPGFGKHGDDPGTRANTRSEWDTLHPGRNFATKEGNVENPKSASTIQMEIVAHLERVMNRLKNG